MQSLAEHIRDFCQKAGLRMNTDLGQHFLIDESVLEAIIETAHIESTDTIVEIGAGIGILTKELIKHAKMVTTIELDKRLLPIFEKYVDTSAVGYELWAMSGHDTKPSAQSAKLRMINDNALNVPFPTEPYKIVANIPYHITSPLLRHAFLEGTRSPTSLTLLIQREVAEKIVDEDDRNMLTIIVGLFGKPRIVCMVPPECFLPPPKVDSAVLHIDCFEQPLTDKDTMNRVFTLTKHAFSQKRKMLRNTISDLPGGDEAMEKSGIDRTRRPQTLTIQEWIALAKAMHQ
jgi:16S rRNA (adenine1518-N6/adenine1519-N6)-dimethyltransferase